MDKALDEVIAEKRATNRGRARGRARGNASRGRAAGNSAQQRQRSTQRYAPYPQAQRQPQAVSKTVSIVKPQPESTKLYVTNLQSTVTQQDVMELFGEVGTLEHAEMAFDQHGRSRGTAEVTYFTLHDARKAMSEYNGVELDGKPMRISYIGGVVKPVRIQQAVVPQQHQAGAPAPLPRNGSGGRGGATRGAARRGGAARGGGRGRGRGGRERVNTKPKTAEELNAELESMFPAAAE